MLSARVTTLSTRLGMVIAATGIVSCSLTTSVDDLSRGGEAGTVGQPDGSAGSEAGLEASSEADVSSESAAEAAVDSGQDAAGEAGKDAADDVVPEAGSDVECPIATKYCAGNCVGLNDPNTGCGSQSCDPCDYANASVICANGGCAIGSCVKDYDDCNDTASDGCEAHLKTDAKNCGGCGNGCAFPHAEGLCAAGACEPGACVSGYEDCNGNKSADGCEVNTAADPANCGACGKKCPDKPGKTATCSSGTCSWSNCAAPLADCDADPDTCETDVSSSAANCGFCSNACAFANASALCAAGTCLLGACLTGYGNCDGEAATGCETDVTISAEHCGNCSNACPARPHSTPQCVAGACKLSCDAGWGDCNGLATDGCEVDLSSSTQNCGGCGTKCASQPYGTPVCTAGACELQCFPGRGNCDGLFDNGCETSISNDSHNCGGCGNECCGGECNGSACNPKSLVSNSMPSYSIAVDANNVYVALFASFGRIQKIAKSNGNKNDLTTAPSPRFIAVDANNVYWTENTGVARSPIANGNRVVLYNGSAGPAFWGITLLGSDLFFTERSSGLVRRLPITGGAPTTIATGAGSPEGIVALPGSPAQVFWASETGTNQVSVVFSDGTGQKALFTGSDGACQMATDGTDLYWTNNVAASGVWKGPIGGGVAVQIATGNQPYGIALGGDYVYWSDFAAGQVKRAKKDGSGATVIGSGSSPRGLAIDDKCVWWVDGNSGSVWGARK